MASMTSIRNELTKKCVEDLEKIFSDADIEFFRTGANLNTLTYVVDEIDGQEIYGSIKFTLHKEGYNLDEEIEEYEMLLEERAAKDKQKQEKAEAAMRERAAKEKKNLDKKLRAAAELAQRKQKIAEYKEKEKGSEE